MRAVVHQVRDVGPVAPADPRDLGLVGAGERVGNELSGQQIGVDAAGHPGREQRPLVAQAPAFGRLRDVLHGVRLQSPDSGQVDVRRRTT
jgi:hypothetical protein